MNLLFFSVISITASSSCQFCEESLKLYPNSSYCTYCGVKQLCCTKAKAIFRNEPEAIFCNDCGKQIRSPHKWENLKYHHTNFKNCHQ
eukprot:UN10242